MVVNTIMVSGETTAVDINFNYNYLLIQTILKMRDAQAKGEIKEYWIYFEYAMGLVLSHIDFNVRGEIEKDFAVLQEAIRKVRKSNLNEQTKNILINKLCEDFANNHRFYIMQALNRIGIVKVEDEGIIDFDKIDIDTMTQIIRDSDRSVIKATEKAEQNPKKIVQPEMVAIYHNGKIVQMPKEEYLKLASSRNSSQPEMIVGKMPENPEEVAKNNEEKLWKKKFEVQGQEGDDAQIH